MAFVEPVSQNVVCSHFCLYSRIDCSILCIVDTESVLNNVDRPVLPINNLVESAGQIFSHDYRIGRAAQYRETSVVRFRFIAGRLVKQIHSA